MWSQGQRIWKTNALIEPMQWWEQWGLFCWLLFCISSAFLMLQKPHFLPWLCVLGGQKGWHTMIGVTHRDPHLSFSSRCCAKMLWQKQLKGGRVYFSEHHGEVKAEGAWRRCRVHQRVLAASCFSLPFLYLHSPGSQWGSVVASSEKFFFLPQ